MTVLVTGGCGYIGSHLVWKLRDSDEAVVVIDRLSSGHRWAIPADVPLIVCDIADTKRVEDVMDRYQISDVVHFAGSIIVTDSVTDPLSYYLNNTAKSRVLIEVAVQAGIKHFIFSSTAAVYGAPDENWVTESSPTQPESPYGRSKLMTEWMLRDASVAHAMRYTILRYFNVAGADPQMRTGQSSERATHLIKVACEAALGRRPYVEIFGHDYPTRDGTCIRDYIHVSDLADIHYLALRRLRAGGANLIANCGYGQGYSVSEVIKTVKLVTGANFEVRKSGRRPGDPSTIVADPATARLEFEWVPKHHQLTSIIAHAFQWEQQLPRRRLTALVGADNL